jgi:MoxR-like ATPase
VQWSPYDQTVYLYDHSQFKTYALRVEGGALRPTVDLAAVGIEIGKDLSSQILAGVQKINTAQKFDLTKPQFEVDGEIARLLNKKTIPARTRYELDTIQKDMQAFVAQINAVNLKKAENQVANNKTLADLQEQKKRIESDDQKVTTLLAKTKASNGSPDQKLEVYYDATQMAFKHLQQMYPELDHAVNAFFVSILARAHLYVFGPPGGAKTSMAREILGSLIRWENVASSRQMSSDVKKFAEEFSNQLISKDKNAAEIFFLQFHKLVPEGVIIGFPKLQEQIDSGKLVFDLSTSLAHQRFIFAILDEVEKGNPAVLTTLLSVLNEREVFAGNATFKTGLRIAALTSNKMPSEFLDYFDDDRPTGTALLDRTLNKVYVSNKFSSKETLTRFMFQIESGLFPHLDMPLPIEELKPLVEKVQVDDYVKHILAEIYDDFTARRLEKEEKSQNLHREDPAEFPDYYVKATSGSNRTFIALLDQVRASFIVSQVMEGVPFKDVKFDVEIKDIPLFLKGLGYWTPIKINPEYDQNGFLKFNLAASSLQKLKDAPTINQRSRYALGAMYEESQDFVDIANNKVHQLLINYREIIAKFPHLFPSLFESDEARDKYLKKPGSK